MDFRGWKKICEDGKTCTLEHPKGHRLTVALKGLSALHRDQIKMLKMAVGGEVNSLDGKVDRYGSNYKETGVTRPPYGSEGKGSHRGIEIERARESGDPNHKKIATGNAKHGARENIDTLKKMPNPKLKGLAHGGVAHYDDGTPDGTVGDDKDSQSTGTNITINAAPSQGAPPAAQQEPAPMVNPMSNMARAPIQVPQPQIPQMAPVVSPGGQTNPAAVMKNATQTIPQGQAAIDSSLAQGENQNIQQLNQGNAAAEQQRVDMYNDMQKRRAQLDEYVKNNPINENHLMENMGTGSKVATAMGLFFGGLGAPFGGHNYAMDYLNKQIDRDIEAQKSRMDQQKTIYGAYHQLYGDGLQALGAAKASMLDYYNNRQKQMAASIGTPVALQRSNVLGNQMATEAEKAVRDSAVPIGSLPGTNSKALMPQQNGPMGGAKSPMGMNPPSQISSGKGAAANGKNNTDAWYENHLLHPNADQMAKDLQYNPQAKDVYPALMEQKAKADLADKAIATLNDVFTKMAESEAVDPDKHGTSGYFHRNGIPGISHIPYVGEAANDATRWVTDTNSNRDYDSKYTSLTGAIRGALQGNVSEDLLNEVVHKNAPEEGDSYDVTQTKMKTLKDFIKSHTKTDVLRQFHLTKS